MKYIMCAMALMLMHITSWAVIESADEDNLQREIKAFEAAGGNASSNVYQGMNYGDWFRLQTWRREACKKFCEGYMCLCATHEGQQKVAEYIKRKNTAVHRPSNSAERRGKRWRREK